MAGWRQAVEVAMTDEDVARLMAISRSRSEPASRARRSTGGPLRVHVHAQTRLLAQPDRGLLLQVCPLGPAPHPGGIKTGVQGTHHGRYRGRQSISGHPHLVLQTRRSCLI
jgi:hypothetical protein